MRNIVYCGARVLLEDRCPGCHLGVGQTVSFEWHDMADGADIRIVGKVLGVRRKMLYACLTETNDDWFRAVGQTVKMSCRCDDSNVTIKVISGKLDLFA